MTVEQLICILERMPQAAPVKIAVYCPTVVEVHPVERVAMVDGHAELSWTY